MITCPACHATYVAGTLFCEQCGSSLIGVEPTESPAADPWGLADYNALAPVSEPLAPVGQSGVIVRQASGMSTGSTAGEPAEGDEETPGTMPLPPRSTGDGGRQMPSSVATRLRVLVLNTGRLTEWVDGDVIHVGRLDRSAGVFPHIDLEGDGGHSAGVSRRHLRILRQPDGYFVEDLGSINGTFLNRRRLSPGAPAELKDGDELRLGNIVLRVVLGSGTRET